MGVDYDGIGGIGVKITDEIVNDLIKSGCIKESGDLCLDNIGISYKTAGCTYSGDCRYYWIVKGENLYEVNTNSQIFIEKLKKIGIEVTTKDLIVIEDICIC